MNIDWSKRHQIPELNKSRVLSLYDCESKLYAYSLGSYLSAANEALDTPTIGAIFFNNSASYTMLSDGATRLW